ncbi:MAG TPA: EamA family transporter, partial [Actinobacteria bacterium]|nr:EamA family transporter [Actinomycetota bacterium]
ATVPGLLTVGWLGVMATAIAYLLLAAGLARTGVNRATTLSLGEPLTATVLGLVVLGERPPAVALLGALLIAAALVSLVVATPTRSTAAID